MREMGNLELLAVPMCRVIVCHAPNEICRVTYHLTDEIMCSSVLVPYRQGCWAAGRYHGGFLHGVLDERLHPQAAQAVGE